ncbi:hypothetical protein BGW41_002796 [Actinomortierella wolfii]|nr:hypothetical protein BGW41_002796 [Actinomortierella wolfii]
MAPIPRLAFKPISILTGAILGAIGPSTSTPPTDGSSPTVWGTEYFGLASLVDIQQVAGNSSVKVDLATNITTPTPSVSEIYYIQEQDNYTACNGSIYFNATDNVVLMNPLQFGNLTDPAQNSTCGQWIDITSRANAAQKIKAQIVGVCDECEYGSISAPLHVLDALAPELDLTTLTFDPASTTNIVNLTDPSQPVSPKDILQISWQLTNETEVDDGTGDNGNGDGGKDDGDKGGDGDKKPTPTPTTTTKKPSPTTKEPSKPSPTKSEPKPTPKPSGKVYSGRGTWFSDTSGQCEHSFSQSDMIVAVNEAQMGKGKNLCGRKLAVKRKGGSTTVIVKVVDMCPSKYCGYGDLDISQGAFKKLADLKVGVLQLEWSFVDGDNN